MSGQRRTTDLPQLLGVVVRPGQERTGPFRCGATGDPSTAAARPSTSTIVVEVAADLGLAEGAAVCVLSMSTDGSLAVDD
jgi:hypothetical protein